jgi:hypothetical protein
MPRLRTQCVNRGMFILSRRKMIENYRVKTSSLLTEQVFHIFAGKRFNEPFIIGDQVFR